MGKIDVSDPKFNTNLLQDGYAVLDYQAAGSALSVRMADNDCEHRDLVTCGLKWWDQTTCILHDDWDHSRTAEWNTAVAAAGGLPPGQAKRVAACGTYWRRACCTHPDHDERCREAYPILCRMDRLCLTCAHVAAAKRGRALAARHEDFGHPFIMEIEADGPAQLWRTFGQLRRSKRLRLGIRSAIGVVLPMPDGQYVLTALLGLRDPSDRATVEYLVLRVCRSARFWDADHLGLADWYGTTVLGWMEEVGPEGVVRAHRLREPHEHAVRSWGGGRQRKQPSQVVPEPEIRPHGIPRDQPHLSGATKVSLDQDQPQRSEIGKTDTHKGKTGGQDMRVAVQDARQDHPAACCCASSGAPGNPGVIEKEPPAGQSRQPDGPVRRKPAAGDQGVGRCRRHGLPVLLEPRAIRAIGWQQRRALKEWLLGGLDRWDPDDPGWAEAA